MRGGRATDGPAESPARGVTFVQYASAASYPPVLAAIAELRRDGWIPRVVGARYAESDAVRGAALDEVPSVHTRVTDRVATSWLRWLALALFDLARRRPRLVYVSDAMATPVALVADALLRLPVVYHEHDSPAQASSLVSRVVLRCRGRVARRARLCILPDAGRAALFTEATGARAVVVVPNYPPRSDALAEVAPPDTPFRLIYHGSLSRDRLPVAFVRAVAAAADDVELVVIGYETEGSRGYVDELLRAAGEAGGARGRQRIRYLGSLPLDAVKAACRTSHAGLSLMPLSSDDTNMRHMIGASNKAYINLAASLAVLVTPLRDWIETFVEPGYGVAVDAADFGAARASIDALCRDRSRVAAMGARGRGRVRDEWNFETAYAPVRERLSAIGRAG